MPINRIAGQMAVVRLIIAHAKIRIFPQSRNQRQREPAVEMRMQNANVPGAWGAALEAGGKGMDGDDHRVITPGGKLGIGGMIGPIKPRKPLFDPVRIQIPIGRNDRAVIKPHHQGRVILAPVRINHQTREIRQDRWAVQGLGQRARQPCRAHIPRDMPRHILGRDAQGSGPHPIGHPIGRMIAGHQPAPRTVLANDLIGLLHGCHLVFTDPV